MSTINNSINNKCEAGLSVTGGVILVNNGNITTIQKSDGDPIVIETTRNNGSSITVQDEQGGIQLLSGFGSNGITLTDYANGNITVSGGQVEITSSSGNTILLTPTSSNVQISTLSDGAVVSDPSGNISSVTGTAGYVLTANSGSAPSFQAASGGISTIDGNTSSVTGSTITLTGGTSGAVFTGNGTTTMTQSFEYLSLPSTDSSSNGTIQINGGRILHEFGGNTNIFLGFLAGNLSLTGTDLTCVGRSAGNVLSSGTDCTFLGFSTGTGITTGSYNSFIGSFAGSGYNTGSESSNICINANGTNGASNQCFIGSGTGTGTNQLSETFISGIQGISVTGSAVLVSSSNQLGVTVSSRRWKENIEDMGNVSSPVLNLRPVTFTYSVGDDKSQQVGLIAEEVQEVLPSLVVLDKEGLPQTVKYHELPVLLLNELQKALKRIEALEAKVGQ